MANLKNITDVPVVESAEGLNLIVNDNGVAKQIAASAVGKVKTVNGTKPDASGNVQIDTTSSWNDLKDKPFYTETDADGNETVHKLDAKYLPSTSINTFYIMLRENDIYASEGIYQAIEDMINQRIPMILMIYVNDPDDYWAYIVDRYTINEDGSYDGYVGNSYYHWWVYPNGEVNLAYED